MKDNFLISTGGSGGHVIPATILYKHLSKDANVKISTDKRGLNFLDNNFDELLIIDTPKLSNIFFLPLNIILIFSLTIKSFFLLKKHKIQKVISTGGYMSLPLIIAAKILSLKIFLFEPNHVLGRANKFFLSSCKKIFCYSENIKNFPEKFINKIIRIDPLVNKNIYESLNSNLEKKKFNILIVGGSQSAKIFDESLKNLLIEISKKIPIKIFHQTSKTNISHLQNFYYENNVENVIFNFDKNFTKTIAQADLCITRAGASTLAELSILNIPFIAVPLPTAKDNHQLLNAQFYDALDCCWLIEQKFFKEKIGEVLRDILENKDKYTKKKENLKKLNYQNTWIRANQKILKILNEN